MEKIVPLTGAPVKGPLGVAHLPRLWLKCVLGAAGMLPEAYITTNIGSNKTVIEGLALDPEATLAYLATMPSYRQFEVWVREHAGQLDAAAIAAVNAAIDAQQKPADNAAAARAFVGLDDPNEGHSSLLNALDDWETVRAGLAARRGTKIAPIVPAVSSQSKGPLGLMHLPRFWMKATLDAAGALYESWHSGRTSGLDVWFCGAIGLDLDAAKAHIDAEFPTYLQFEAWAVANATHLSAGEIPAHNEAMRVRQKPAEVADRECALLGIERPADYRPSIELNDLVDWHTIHANLAAARSTA